MVKQIVGQPIGAIDRLRRLQRGAPAAAAMHLGRGDAVAPTGDLAPQYAEIVEHAAGVRPATASPPRPQGAPIAAVAAEQLVAALARQDHLDPGRACRAGQNPTRQDRVIGGRVVGARHDLGQQPPEISLAKSDLDMLGADRRGRRARRRALVGLAVGEADRKRLDRALGEPRHHRQDRGQIDAARQKQPERHVRTLVHAHAVGERRIEPGQRLVLANRDRAVFGQCRALLTLDDPPLPHDHGLSRQNPADPGKDRLPAGGELHLDELVARPPQQLRGDDAGLDQRIGLGGEGEPPRGLGVIERLDPERVARQHQATSAGVVQRQRIHAAQMLRELEPVATIKMQRQLAIRLGRKRNRAGAAAQCLAQLDVIVDLGIGDQRGAAGLIERLRAGREIDNREPGLHHADIARAVLANAVGAAVAQYRFHRP